MNQTNFFKPLAGLLVVALLLLIAVACSAAPDPESIYTRITEGVLSGGDPIPAPTDDVIVTVTGKIGAINSGDSIQMDLPTIESVGLVDYTVEDPFEGAEVTFRGVLMRDLIELWQVDETATTLEMVALNDYVVDVPIADLREYPVVFALQEDGEYMPVARRGPAMLVYPYNHYDLDPSVYNDFWIWQIASVNVR